MSSSFDCEERVVTDLHFVERAVQHGDREFRLGNRPAAKHDYLFAHGLLRRAFGTTRGCLTMEKVTDAKYLLRRLADVADKFEHFEQKIEGG